MLRYPEIPWRNVLGADDGVRSYMVSDVLLCRDDVLFDAGCFGSVGIERDLCYRLFQSLQVMRICHGIVFVVATLDVYFEFPCLYRSIVYTKIKQTAFALSDSRLF